MDTKGFPLNTRRPWTRKHVVRVESQAALELKYNGHLCTIKLFPALYDIMCTQDILAAKHCTKNRHWFDQYEWHSLTIYFRGD